MIETPYFIDTNIVMYARGKDHFYKKPCVNLILRIADGSFEKSFGTPVIDSEVFQEIIYRYVLVGEWPTALSVCRDMYALGIEILSVGSPEVKNVRVDRKIHRIEDCSSRSGSRCGNAK